MLTRDQATKAIVRNNASPDAILALPDLRATFGIPGPSDEYDEAVVEAIADWQRSCALGADGILGPLSRARAAALRYFEGRPCDDLWPGPKTIGYDAHYADLAERVGAARTPGRPLLIGLRGCYPFATRTHRTIHAPRYDDAFVLLVDGIAPVVFAGATHAYQLYSSESPDVSGDGVGDVGSIRPGRYLMRLVVSSPPEFEITMTDGSRDLPAFRDTDHDGVISEAEALASAAMTRGRQVVKGKGATANAVLFHPGWDVKKPGTVRNFSSIACQTAPLSSMQRLARAGSPIDFVLTNADDVGSSRRPFEDTDPPRIA